jgi:hypothetical protein
MAYICRECDLLQTRNAACGAMLAVRAKPKLFMPNCFEDGAQLWFRSIRRRRGVVSAHPGKQVGVSPDFESRAVASGEHSAAQIAGIFVGIRL